MLYLNFYCACLGKSLTCKAAEVPSRRMLKSALDYLGGAGLSATVSEANLVIHSDDPLVGSIVDVGGVKVAVKRR